MITEDLEKLQLTNLIPNKGLVMAYWSKNLEKVQAFKEACYSLLGRDTGWFHQCNSDEYQMFEFWVGRDKLPLVRERCTQVAKEVGLELLENIDESKFFA